jgi:hypothetical protein
MRIEDVFDAAGINLKGKPIPLRRIKTTCPTCRKTRNLAGIEPTNKGLETIYDCPKCGNPILIISPVRKGVGGPGGYRLGRWIITPIGDMKIDVPGLEKPL